MGTRFVSLADRDAHYKLAGLIEMDDTYFGAPKPGSAAAARRQGQSGGGGGNRE